VNDELPAATASTASSWAERAADRSPSVQRSRERSLQRAQQIVQAARRLVEVKGSDFTTQDLVKEAGIAVQTFYKHFPGKDQVILAVIEDMVAETCAGLAEEARTLADPVARIRFYVTSIISGIAAYGEGDARPRFITTEHWRLHRLYPDELARANRPFTDLLLPEITAATKAGSLTSVDPEYDAWLITRLVISVFHHYEYATPEGSLDQIAERLWSFCYRALGGGNETAGRRRKPSTRRAG
jgi:AcrR family transcriptional regulator